MLTLIGMIYAILKRDAGTVKEQKRALDLLQGDVIIFVVIGLLSLI